MRPSVASRAMRRPVRAGSDRWPEALHTTTAPLYLSCEVTLESGVRWCVVYGFYLLSICFLRLQFIFSFAC